MITILMVISDTNIGGAGKWIGEAFRCMDPSRFQVKAVIPRHSKLKHWYDSLGLPVIECNGIADRSFSVSGVTALYRIFQKKSLILSTRTAQCRQELRERSHSPM